MENELKYFLYLLFFLGFAYLIAHLLGRKRQIGFGWAFFFAIFLNPFGGFITTMLSRKYIDKNPQPSSTKIILGWILMMFFTFSTIIQLIGIRNVPDEHLIGAIGGITYGFGFAGLGYYLIQLGKGKNFNTKALTKTDD